MQAVSNIGNQSKWKQTYRDALFEVDPTRLQPKLEAAWQAVEERLLEVLLFGRGPGGPGPGGPSPRELIELQDARQNLQYLARNELQA
jgi:hypothetical protein